MRAAFERRPGDLVRVLVTPEAAGGFGDLLRHCARHRLPYRLVPAEEVAAVAGSTHHEGICAVTRPRPEGRLEDLLALPGPGVLLALGGVQNPHNVGAILRTAAHFGVRGALLGGAGLTPAAHRTAQGGAEWVEVVSAPELAAALAACRRAGYAVCATGARGRDLFAEPLPGRVMVLLGAEGAGLAPELLAHADHLLAVPGTGRVESLNVAAAAAVLLGELWRRRAAR